MSDADQFRWAELRTAAELHTSACPLCNTELPDWFLLFRPNGYTTWRCLRCSAKQAGTRFA
jgi:hypothetical protein